MVQPQLNPDTQVVLLLCGRFPSSDHDDALVLSLREYNMVAHWLRRTDLRPADLLTSDSMDRMADDPDMAKIAPRISSLLERGAALALAIESWTNRGLWVLARSDDQYPLRLKERLKNRTPPLLYGFGKAGILTKGGLAIVGSRNADAQALRFARGVAEAAARYGVPVISGGARGVDRESLVACLEAGGQAIGVLPDGLERAAVSRQFRSYLASGLLAFVSPYDPSTRFNVGNAMGRNKLIYALSNYGLVVSSDAHRGGTWAGAVEALDAGIVPVFVRDGTDVPDGNQRLIERGGVAVDPSKYENADGVFLRITRDTQMSANTAEPRDPITNVNDALTGSRQLVLSFNLRAGHVPKRERE